MAEMSFEIITENGSENVENILSYEWQRDSDAACDAVRLTFIPDLKPPSEAQRLKAFYNGVCVFSGYVDYQSAEKNGKGVSEFIYARSSACLLVDNEARQMNYYTPCTDSLFMINALPFGFKNGLKNYSINSDYFVPKGTSCYGVLNTFIRAFEEKSVTVSPDGMLYVPSGEKNFFIDSERVLSEQKTVNRGKAVSRIDYKTDAGYVHHRKSRLLEDKNIRRSRQMNMASLPEWQRSTALSNRLRRSAEDYYCAKITVEGVITAGLYSPVIYNDEYNDYYISALHTVFNKEKTVTAISLRKKLKLREADYVD